MSSTLLIVQTLFEQELYHSLLRLLQLDVTLEEQPDEEKLSIVKAQAQAKLGMHVEALASYARVYDSTKFSSESKARAQQLAVTSLLATNNKKDAMAMIANIPMQFRSLKDMCRLADHMHHDQQQYVAAAELYTHILTIQPNALEVSQALTTVEVYLDVVTDNCICMSLRQLITENSHNWLLARRLVEQRHFSQAVDIYSGILHAQPSNTLVKAATAGALASLGRHIEALSLFAQVQHQEPICVVHMDLYVDTLLRESIEPIQVTHDKVRSLVHHLMLTNPAAPQTWVAAALYVAHTEDVANSEVSMCNCIFRALELDPSYEYACIVQGEIYLNVYKQYDKSINSFMMARNIQPSSVQALVGLCRARRSNGQFKQALSLAKIALQRMPRDATALALVGSVLACSHEGKAKAEKAFVKALFVQPGHTQALHELIKLYKAQHQAAKAMEVLNTHMPHTASTHLRWQLIRANLLRDLDQPMEALAIYQSILKVNPIQHEATEGIAAIDATV